MVINDFELVAAAVKTVAKQLNTSTDNLITTAYTFPDLTSEKFLPIGLTMSDGEGFNFLHKNPKFLGFGLQEVIIRSKDRSVSLTCWMFNIGSAGRYSMFYDFPIFILPRSDYFRFLRICATHSEDKKHVFERPILDDAVLDLVYKNTIGFLEKREEYAKFNIPIKRGLMFFGSPGNGKTSLIKWIRTIAAAKHFDTRTVNLQELQRTINQGFIEELFDYDGKPTIVSFDDVDIAFKDRKKNENSPVSHFLTGMDGVVPSEGAVFIFTTNQELSQLDPALTRPGRIDVNIKLDNPSTVLRAKFVMHRFGILTKHLGTAELDNFVQLTNGLSFAEIESVRQEIAKRVVDGHRIDMKQVFEEYKVMRAKN